jgi:hypothetical protein
VKARAAASIAFLAALPAFVAPEGLAADARAEGTLTVNGKTAKLAYAYAWVEPGFFDKKKEDVHVILSDVPLPPKALEDTFERIHMADEGRLHAMEVIFSADGKVISTSFRDKAFKASPSGVSSDDVFEQKTFDGKSVAGRFRSTKPHEFFGDVYSFDVTFDAPVARKAKPVPPAGAGKK